MDLADRVTVELEARLGELTVLDAHTHLVGGRLSARGLDDLLLYHMVVSDLFAAGCPDGARLTQYPLWPDRKEAHDRIRRAVPYLVRIRNTSTMWALRMMLDELYAWRAPIDESNWGKLDAAIRERAADPAWGREVMRKARIERACTEWARRGDGCDDDLLVYSLEWAFFTRCQWGEYDTGLYELERCWGKTPESPMPIGAGPRPAPERTLQSLDDVHDALHWYVDHIPADRVGSIATHLSTDIDYEPPSRDQMQSAMAKRGAAGARERDIYAAYIHEAFLDVLEARYGDTVLFQFSLGAEPLPHETASRISQTTIRQVGEMIGRHPRLRFQCYLSSAHANQSLCTLCRELPNLSLAGYWWHNFFPSVMSRVMAERLDMLPLNKQIGFFSDAYCIEWAWAKAAVVRKVLARVLASKIALGQYDLESGMHVARAILYESAKPQMRLV